MTGVRPNFPGVWAVREAVFGVLPGALAGLPARLCAGGGAAAGGCGGKLHWRLHLSFLGC